MSKELIDIEGGEDTPSVKQEGLEGSSVITISGVSMPESTLEFYAPLIEQLVTGCAGINDLKLVFHLDYMNSMSNKQILKVILSLAKVRTQFSVTWKYSANDELMKLKGEEMKSILDGIQFNVSEA